tara:strand:- start:978 stop:1691 length:714 start_codon:yes stop_codon:yes gene_type:complete
MLTLFDYYKSLLRATTKQPPNYSLPELPEDVCKLIFSYVELDIAATIIPINLRSSIRDKVRHYCKLISEDKSVYQEYIEQAKASDDPEFSNRRFATPRQTINIVNDINTRAVGPTITYSISTSQFRKMVPDFVKDIYDEELNVWHYKWYSKEENENFRNERIEKFKSEYKGKRKNMDYKAEEYVGILIHFDHVLERIQLRNIKWVSKNIVDMEYFIAFNYVDYVKGGLLRNDHDKLN